MKLNLGWTTHCLDPAFGVDIDRNQTVGVEQLLHSGASRCEIVWIALEKHRESTNCLLRQRGSGFVQCPQQLPTVLAERCPFDFLNNRKRGLHIDAEDREEHQNLYKEEDSKHETTLLLVPKQSWGTPVYKTPLRVRLLSQTRSRASRLAFLNSAWEGEQNESRMSAIRLISASIGAKS